MTETAKTDHATPFLGACRTDALADAVRSRLWDSIEMVQDEKLEAALGRCRYEPRPAGVPRCGAPGYRNGDSGREIVGTFGPETIGVPRARTAGADGQRCEWRSQALPRYRRLTRKAETLLAGAVSPAPTRAG